MLNPRQKGHQYFKVPSRRRDIVGVQPVPIHREDRERGKRLPSSFFGLALLLLPACSGSPGDPPALPSEQTALPRATVELSGRILGQAAHDDDSDIEITLEETKGVAFDVNFVRLTCSNGVSREWGATSFIAELGSNRVDGGATLVVRRHYFCPSSGRPRELLADLTDESGFHHVVIAAPYHPDWPGA